MTSRSKGRKGETRAEALLLEHDFIVYDMTSGKKCADFIAHDPTGVIWSVEVKNRIVWEFEPFYAQAKRYRKGKSRWMLMLHIPQTSSWLVLRQGMKPTVWHER